MIPESMQSSVAAIIIRGGKVFVAKRKAGGDLGGKWEFPGGKTDEGEEPALAVSREMLEEFGATAKALVCLGSSNFEHDGKSFKLYAYETRLESPILHHFEHDEIAWVDIADLEKLHFAESDIALFPYVRELFQRLVIESFTT